MELLIFVCVIWLVVNTQKINKLEQNIKTLYKITANLTKSPEHPVATKEKPLKTESTESKSVENKIQENNNKNDFSSTNNFNIEFEKLFLGNIFNKIGAISLIIALIIFLKLAHLTQTAQIILAYLLGLGTIAAAVKMHKGGLKNYSEIVMGIGIGVLYITTYCGTCLYRIIPTSASILIGGILILSAYYIAQKFKSFSTFAIGHIEIQSKITLQKSNLIFALMQYAGGDFHCAIKEYSDDAEFNRLKNDLIKVYLMNTITEIIRAMDEYFGKEYFTLKDIFIEERRKILQIMLKGKLAKFSQIYQQMYDDGKGAIYNLQGLGLNIPDEFKISAAYALSKKFNDIVTHSGGFLDDDMIQQAVDINFEAKRIEITLDKKSSNVIFSKKILQNVNRLVHSFEIQQAEVLLEIFDNVEKLELQVDIAEAQNTYFAKIYHRIGDILETDAVNKNSANRRFIEMLLDIGGKLNINTEFYQKKLDKLLLQ